ncbi:MAG TPA: hypothetical protein VL172_15110 [Kofleriaceae bacterium]|nr:hypothetical protein [Kofleriaceae bacterium]
MSTHRALIVGVGLSLLLHALLGAGMHVRGKAPEPAVAEGETDIELAPEAPEAHLPQPGGEEAAPAPPPEPEPTPEPEPQVAHTDPDRPGTIDEPEAPADAGVVAMNDAAAAAGDATMVAQADAGAADAGTQVAAAEDAGADGGGALAGAGGDAGALATGEPGGPGDGTGAAPTNEPDPYDGKPPPGAASNLLTYFPAGERVSVVIRLDRFRGTMWSRRLDKIIQPMPDYDGLAGKRKLVLSDEFESMIISSNEPRNAKATTVMVRYKRTPAQMRVFLGKGGASVSWRPSRVGALGTRAESPMIAKGDARVFVLPFPRYAVLARPRILGKLSPPPGATVDTFPPDAALPEWLRRVKGVEEETGSKGGPAVVITAGSLPKNIKIPNLGKIPGPDRLTASLELVKGGVIIRGNMVFADEARAQAFVDQAAKFKEFLLDSWKGKLALAATHSYNAVKGLSMRRAGRQVGYATSISVADFKEMTDYAAELSAAYFHQLAEDAEEAAKAGGDGASHPPAGSNSGSGSTDSADTPGGPSGPPN